MIKNIHFRIASILLTIIVLLSVSFSTISTLVTKSGVDKVFWVIILTVVYYLVGIVVSSWIGGKIAKPISIYAGRLYALSEGDLKSPVPQIHTKNETGRLVDVTEVTVSNLRTIISDLVSLLEALSRSNFNVRSQVQDAYHGDFKPLSDHSERIMLSSNDTLSQINQSAGMVSNESEQISYGAQSLTQGASEQTVSIEELAVTIHHLPDKVKENALNAAQAGKWATRTMGEVGQCNDKMQSMVQAMKRIEQTSSQISNIIKAVEDIAFQTNILALNATAEASRAGEADKSFAVVADEARSLASKSAESAKSASALISDPLNAVSEGSRMVGEALDALQAVAKSMAETQREHREIVEVTEEQSTAVDHLTTVMDQISAVVQTNSATAEEGAAAGEELSSQAQMMKSLVSQFQLRSSSSAPARNAEA